ncbi:hypothetical protein MMC13_004585 [Lambiella insularis]|nr:hypothetical protein [Lambiella insularis]
MVDSSFLTVAVSYVSLQHRSVFAVASLLVLLLAWRLWRFTIAPLLWPDEPKTLPYYFPIIGHTWSFMSNAEATLDTGSKRFPRGEPYLLSLGGVRTLIVRDIDMVDRVWKDSTALTFDPFIVTTMKVFGISSFCREQMFRRDPATLLSDAAKATSLLSTANPARRCYSDCMREWLKAQLLPGERLEGLREVYEGFIADSLRPGNLASDFILSSSGGEQTISLRSFTRTILTNGALRAFFGPELFEVAPGFAPGYKGYEDESWKIFFQYPEFMSRKLHRSKNRALDGFVKYFALPREQTPGMAWVFHTMNVELANLGVEIRDRAGFMFLITWAVNNNAHHMGFWLFSHILCEPDLYQAVRTEVGKACRPDRSLDMKILTTECPTLDSCWYEVLRIYNAASTAREAMEETTIGGKLVHKGDRILTPFRQFQMDPTLFGADARSFNPDRFLKNEKLHKGKGYHPFGGGTTYCPGRFFAQQETYMLVALVFDGFDMSVVGPRVVPKLDVNTPVPAAMRTMSDMRIKLVPRKHN